MREEIISTGKKELNEKKSKDTVTNALLEFKTSEQKAEDYMKMFLVLVKYVRFDHGLMWSDVEEILEEQDKL